MGNKVLMKGNEAIAEGAILAGCQAYFGYPITPQNELLEYMSRRMPELERVFVQTESELSAISMVLGASAAGFRAMTSTSSPGFSLQQEGISYMAGSELPAVVVNVMRGGPGLGGILGAQGDYFQAVKGGGHGDYRLLVLAPASAQEAMDLTMLAFDLADKYRNPVVLLVDGYIGQVTEPVELRAASPPPPDKPWAVTGARGRSKNVIRSIYLQPERLEAHDLHLAEKFERMRADELRYEGLYLDDAKLVIVAYGSVARVAQTVVKQSREQGLPVGLLRPISLYPFPYQPIVELAERAKAFLVAELSLGQMVEDVRLAVGKAAPVFHVRRLGGMVLSVEEVCEALAAAAGEVGVRAGAPLRCVT
ncbi:MAG: 3-methyl-2-oxobutanoate dehydrogenase subunit VorB [Chloroflexi bacterium]|nr:3-methyl-2-oxobutanoate dehydrogenase subunit VorB [Chloroflexota bacterium]